MIALLAVMVALAVPNAHGDFNITCGTSYGISAGGLAYPWADRIELSTYICRLNFKTILHRHVTPQQAGLAVQDLLHEASHVGQWREDHNVFSDPTRAYEHDADCRALRALPGVLTAMKYKPRFVRAATESVRVSILYAAAPYGGSCLTG